MTRWRLVIQRYGRLQAIVRGNARLQRETGITLLDVNQFTLGTWYASQLYHVDALSTILRDINFSYENITTDVLNRQQLLLCVILS